MYSIIYSILNAFKDVNFNTVLNLGTFQSHELWLWPCRFPLMPTNTYKATCVVGLIPLHSSSVCLITWYFSVNYLHFKLHSKWMGNSKTRCWIQVSLVKQSAILIGPGELMLRYKLLTTHQFCKYEVFLFFTNVHILSHW